MTFVHRNDGNVVELYMLYQRSEHRLALFTLDGQLYMNVSAGEKNLPADWITAQEKEGIVQHLINMKVLDPINEKNGMYVCRVNDAVASIYN